MPWNGYDDLLAICEEMLSKINALDYYKVYNERVRLKFCSDAPLRWRCCELVYIPPRLKM